MARLTYLIASLIGNLLEEPLCRANRAGSEIFPRFKVTPEHTSRGMIARNLSDRQAERREDAKVRHTRTCTEDVGSWQSINTDGGDVTTRAGALLYQNKRNSATRGLAWGRIHLAINGS